MTDLLVSCRECGGEVVEPVAGPVLYGQDGYFFTPERLALWDRELRAGGFNAGAMSLVALAPLLSGRCGMGVDQGRIAGLALRRWLAGVGA